MYPGISAVQALSLGYSFPLLFGGTDRDIHWTTNAMNMAFGYGGGGGGLPTKWENHRSNTFCNPLKGKAFPETFCASPFFSMLHLICERNNIHEYCLFEAKKEITLSNTQQ